MISIYAKATTLHFDGLVLEGQVDGGQQARSDASAQRKVCCTANQSVATCWYHLQLDGRMGYQVAIGLADMDTIEDLQTGRLQLPSQWGVDACPLIFQDQKLIKQNGAIDYAVTHQQAALGWFGDILSLMGNSIRSMRYPTG